MLVAEFFYEPGQAYFQKLLLLPLLWPEESDEIATTRLEGPRSLNELREARRSCLKTTEQRLKLP